MNITDDIKEKVSKEVAEIIDNNLEIQFYINPTIDAYQWMDARFNDTASVWQNGKFESEQLLIESFKDHLDHLDRFVF